MRVTRRPILPALGCEHVTLLKVFTRCINDSSSQRYLDITDSDSMLGCPLCHSVSYRSLQPQGYSAHVPLTIRSFCKVAWCLPRHSYKRQSRSAAKSRILNSVVGRRRACQGVGGVSLMNLDVKVHEESLLRVTRAEAWVQRFIKKRQFRTARSYALHHNPNMRATGYSYKTLTKSANHNVALIDR